MEENQDASAACAGPSRDVDSGEAAGHVEGNPVAQLQSQIHELGQRHNEVMATLVNMSNANTRSYVYIPRERQIVPFSGNYVKDGQSVDEFIDEVERVIRVRGLNTDDQVDFILSHLRGSALDEVKLRMGGETTQPSDLFSYLRGAFREKRTIPQLLHAFYARRQSEGEDFRDFSHSLSQLLSSAIQQSPNAVSQPQLTLRDQFVEGIRDSHLRRELRKLVREKPQSTLFEVRKEALMWVSEDRPRGASVARSHNIVSTCSEVPECSTSGGAVQTDIAVALQEVVKIITQQGKAIGELTNAVRELTVQKASSSFQEPVHYCPKLCGAGKRSSSIALSRAMRGKPEGSRCSTLTKERFLERAVGKCPEVDIHIGGVPVRCLLDTGSNVSTLTESFFRENLHGEDKDLHCTSGWLRITAANKLPLPYLGYVELDIKVMGLIIPEYGFLIVRDRDTADLTPPGIIGMNITQRCREFALTEFDTTLGGKLDSVWREAFSRVQEVESAKATSVARVSGRGKTHIPAASAATVYARVNKKVTHTNAWLLLEPGNSPLPGGLILMPTLVSPRSHVFPVQVINFSQEDVWLPPKVQLGILTHCQCAESDICDVKFQRISADHEEVRIDEKEEPLSDSDLSNLLSRLHMGGTPEQQTELGVLLMRHADVFAVHDEDLGFTDRVKHEIHLTDDTPIAQPYRRLPPTQFEEVKQHISGLLRKGVIQESSSPYASLIVLVRKSDGSLRLCVDYRRLNSKTRRDAFPLPRIDESLDALSGAQVFSTIDLASGYHQVAVDEKDRPKTAFTTPFGLFEYRRMPFGLCNAPATFQRLMQATMSDLVFQIVLIYLDDLLVYSSTFHDHLVRLETVFRRLRETGLKIKIEKCNFLQPEVKFLGHQVSAQGVSTDPDKISAVREWPVPSTLKELRSFLGFCSYYRRFIEGFSQIAGPLHDVVNVCLRETSSIKAAQVYRSSWTSQCQTAFANLKDKLTSAPTLGYADFTLPFVIKTDASNLGLGAVLYQHQNGKKTVIAYASRRLRGAEKNDQNYSSMKLELLALKWAVTEKFRSYRWGPN
ncbi:uncharacterized protein LOC130215772 [Danio aesculapii]|uniref:uncharacterized protein LOC130215772 n=1 Tax=Danio aesculapii TaxID=1142201 RepID=UPI0024BFF636|nr:uncharacterized protein LOC130215772 [Danio aesculapii]